MAADKEVVSGAIVKEAAVFDKFLQVRMLPSCREFDIIGRLLCSACILRLDNHCDS